VLRKRHDLSQSVKELQGWLPRGARHDRACESAWSANESAWGATWSYNGCHSEALELAHADKTMATWWLVPATAGLLAAQNSHEARWDGRVEDCTEAQCCATLHPLRDADDEKPRCRGRTPIREGSYVTLDFKQMTLLA
jgi:hypothetical protein